MKRTVRSRNPGGFSLAELIVWLALFSLVGSMVLSTLIIFPFGVAVAWLLARRNWPGKSVIETIVALPLVMPPVATGLILLNLLGRGGPVGAFLQNIFGLEIVFTWKAVVAAMAVMSFPFLVRTVRLAFEDKGPGIADVQLALTEGWTSGSGMGVGLSGSRRLVNDFDLRTVVGQGTCVTVTRWK